MNNRLLHEHDFRAQFALRLADHQRTNSPRQRRLAAERNLVLARYHEIASAIIGGVILAILVILFFLV